MPRDGKSSTLLQGRYLGEEEKVQILSPARVMDDLLDTILTVRNYIMIAVFLVGLATLATMTLVFILSLQLRRRERETMMKIGGSRTRIASILIAEIVGVLLAGGLLALLLSVLTLWLAPLAARIIVMLA